jgi:large subunit ribosomal protein L10
MKPKSQKKEELKKLKEKFPKSKITIFTTFSRAGEKGLSVAQMSELKKTLRTINAELFVTKKTLMDLALKDLKSEANVYDMEGSVGLVFGVGESSGAKSGISVNDDAYAISKKLYEFSKKNKALQFFGAIFEGNFVNKDGFLEMAKMPSKEVLIGRLLGMLTYPIRGLAVALSEVAKKQGSAS